MNDEQNVMLFGIALAIHLARIAGGNPDASPQQSFVDADKFIATAKDRGIDLDKVRG